MRMSQVHFRETMADPINRVTASSCSSLVLQTERTSTVYDL